jgi:shikimate dehydrogenase
MRSNSILVGLVGAGIQSSLTPRLHEKEGDALGLHYMYKLIDLDVLGLSTPDLPEILTAAERLGFAGLNITYPCKQAVIGELHELSPDARAIGAVNAVIFSRGRRFGHNTDWTG